MQVEHLHFPDSVVTYILEYSFVYLYIYSVE
jgi:hypothetical protein